MKIKRNSRDAQTEPMDTLPVPKAKRRIWELRNSRAIDQDLRDGSIATPLTVCDPVVHLLKPRTAMSLSRLAVREQPQANTPNQTIFPFKFESFVTPKRPFLSPLSPLLPDYCGFSLFATFNPKTKTPVSNHSEKSLLPANEFLPHPHPYKTTATCRLSRPVVPSTGLSSGKSRRKPKEKPKVGVRQLRRRQKSLNSWRLVADTFGIW